MSSALGDLRSQFDNVHRITLERGPTADCQIRSRVSGLSEKVSNICAGAEDEDKSHSKHVGAQIA